MAFLLVNNGPDKGRQYDLVDGEYIVGRHRDCNIVIDVGAVSRQHCKITVSGSTCFVQDLRSRNGTFLNERVIQGRNRLQHSDQVRVCDTVFKFCTQPTEESSGQEDSTPSAVMVDDDTGSSTIMSTLDVISARGRAKLTASPEAKLGALMAITQNLVKALSLDEVLPQVLDSLFRIFHQADRGFIGLVDEKGVLVPRWTKLRRSDSDETIRVSRTIAKQVMDTKGAILSADAASDKRFEMSESVVDFRIRSMMCAPLVDSDGKAMGILQVDTPNQHERFQDEDLALLVSVAYQASIAIDNARLHEEALERRTLERDLKLARDVQHAFLPDAPPALEGYEFFDYYRAANHIGGDYYDYIRLPDGRLAIVVADVVGHGVAAAMLMAKLYAETRFCLASEPHPATAVTNLNARLCRLNLHRFVTFVMAALDAESHEITIVNAGHMPPLYRRDGGGLDEPSRVESSIPLGVVAGTMYQQSTVTLQPGESLTMYTDGIDEARNSEGKQFTSKRLRELVKSSVGSPKEIGESILEQVTQHLAGRQADDDMCLVAFRRQ